MTVRLRILVLFGSAALVLASCSSGSSSPSTSRRTTTTGIGSTSGTTAPGQSSSGTDLELASPGFDVTVTKVTCTSDPSAALTELSKVFSLVQAEVGAPPAGSGLAGAGQTQAFHISIEVTPIPQSSYGYQLNTFLVDDGSADSRYWAQTPGNSNTEGKVANNGLSGKVDNYGQPVVMETSLPSSATVSVYGTWSC